MIDFESIKITLDISIDRVDAIVWSSDSKSIHALLINEFGPLCSCMGFMTHKMCKHIKSLIFYLANNGFDFNKIMERSNMIEPRTVPTEMSGFNENFGGLPVGLLFGLVGKPKVGKSLLMVHFAFDIIRYYIKQKKIKNVLFLDTEGGLAEHFMSTWVPVLNERYGLDVDVAYYRIDMAKWRKKKGPHLPLKPVHVETNKKPKIIVIDVDDLKRLMLIHGRQAKLDYGKGGKDNFDEVGSGKVTVLPQASWGEEWEFIEDTPIAKWVVDHNIGGIMYDSLTQPMQAEFPTSTQAFPGRASANMTILSQAQKLIKEYDLVGVISHHLSQNPMNSYDKPRATGGNPIGYNFKKMLQLMPSANTREKNYKNKRKCRIMRDSDKPSNEVEFSIEIRDDGVR